MMAIMQVTCLCDLPTNYKTCQRNPNNDGEKQKGITMISKVGTSGKILNIRFYQNKVISWQFNI